jgi:hypothetical protein
MIRRSRLVQRVFELDRCPNCDEGQPTINAAILGRQAIETRPVHLWLEPMAPAGAPSAREGPVSSPRPRC